MMFKAILISLILILMFNDPICASTHQKKQPLKIYGIEVGESLKSIHSRCWRRRIKIENYEMRNRTHFVTWKIPGALDLDADVSSTLVEAHQGQIVKTSLRFKSYSLKMFHAKVAEFRMKYPIRGGRVHVDSRSYLFEAQFVHQGHQIKVLYKVVPDRKYAEAHFFDLSQKKKSLSL